MVTCNAHDKFLLVKSIKKVLRRVNFTNLKTPNGYIAKSKPQGVCLQLTQTSGGDYVIWPQKYTAFFGLLVIVLLDVSEFLRSGGDNIEYILFITLLIFSILV